ncbi:MAG: ATP-binding protein [Anaerolineae bacterium]
MVTIRDHGRPFDPEAVPPPNFTSSLAERREGMLGLHFMRQLMDEVCFRFDAEGNKLTMVKRRCQ